MSFVVHHSHLVALQIEQASSVAELKQAALRMDAMVVLLHERRHPDRAHRAAWCTS